MEPALGGSNLADVDMEIADRVAAAVPYYADFSQTSDQEVDRSAREGARNLESTRRKADQTAQE
jgi:hypothetical protein